jgi:hypothetical protein
MARSMADAGSRLGGVAAKMGRRVSGFAHIARWRRGWRQFADGRRLIAISVCAQGLMELRERLTKD